MFNLRLYQTRPEFEDDYPLLPIPTVAFIEKEQVPVYYGETTVFEVADDNLRDLLIASFGSDGERITIHDILKVTDVTGIFTANDTIREFNEFKYFMSLPDVPADCFRECAALEEITLPKQVKSIGDHAFAHAGSLTKVIMQEGLERLEANAFNSCTSLTSITVPSSLRYIGQYCWCHCHNLKEIIILAETPPYAQSWSMISDCPELTGIYVPNESVAAYQNQKRWAGLAGRIKPIGALG